VKIEAETSLHWKLHGSYSWSWRWTAAELDCTWACVVLLRWKKIILAIIQVEFLIRQTDGQFNCKCKAPQVVRDNQLQRIHHSCFHHAQFLFVSFFWADCYWQLWSVVWDCDIVPFWISCDLHRVRLWQTWALDTTFKQRSLFIHPPWRSAMNKWTLLMEGHREIKLSVYFCHVFFPNYTVYQCATEDILGMAKF